MTNFPNLNLKSVSADPPDPPKSKKPRGPSEHDHEAKARANKAFSKLLDHLKKKDEVSS